MQDIATITEPTIVPVKGSVLSFAFCVRRTH